jgi:Tfp pilus assembly protein PilO
VENLKRNYKSILISVTTIVFLVVLTFINANFVIGKINAVSSETSTIEARLETLQSRIAVLEAAVGSVELVNIAALAIPEKNPSVLLTGQLKSLALEHSVSIENLSITSTSISDDEPMLTYEVNFSAIGGDYESLSNFIDGLSTILPLVNLGSANIRSVTASGVESEIRLTAYSAVYPESLPTSDQPLSGLSPQEQEILTSLETFRQIVSTPPESTEVPTRPNPFSPGI